MNKNNHSAVWPASFVLLLLGLMALGTAVMMNLPQDNAALGLLCIGLILIMMAVGQYWSHPINGETEQ